jgi:hypothetical protein
MCDMLHRQQERDGRPAFSTLVEARSGAGVRAAPADPIVPDVTSCFLPAAIEPGSFVVRERGLSNGLGSAAHLAAVVYVSCRDS